jgi:phosphohistidine phosphatase
MQRTLILMRHAKSDWSQAGVADHERALNARGRRSAPLIAEKLIESSINVDVILASTAVRVQETVQLLQQSWARQAEVLTERSLYLASVETLTATVQGSHDSWNSIMLVGHNPGMAEFVSLLAKQYLDMPTAAVAILTSDIGSWHGSVRSGNWKLQAFWKPRDIE